VVGRFISLEGGEGVGKSTQLHRLAEALRARGHDVVETREPGGSAGAEAIRALILEGEANRWTARSEALLFAAARADHVARTIRPALEAGRWVLSDRFLDSSLAYQGGADGIGVEAIRALHAIGSEGLLPDRTLVLDLEPATAASRENERDGGRLDRIGSRGTAYHGDVVAAFRRIAETEPDRVRLVDASGAPETVTARLLDALGDLS
jgi:dTMP kinase